MPVDHKKLGMNIGTATNRLVKDVLFAFVQKECISCFHCRRPLTRETLSIEHKEPWLNHEDPLLSFFDLDNISFSHLSCNSKAGAKKNGNSDV